MINLVDTAVGQLFCRDTYPVYGNKSNIIEMLNHWSIVDSLLDSVGNTDEHCDTN